jgi:integrase
MALTATAVKQAKSRDKPYKLTDGRGMYLLVQPSGSRYWRFKYRFGGREKTLALGVYPDVSLARAREKLQSAREKLADGIDPSVVKQLEKLNMADAVANSFESIAREWFAVRMDTRSEKHKSRVMRAMENDLFPNLGSRPISQISAPELLAVLRRVESRGAIETAHRVKQVAGQIFRYGIATGRAERDPSGDLKGALRQPVKRHLAAITEPEKVGSLLRAMDSFEGTPAVRSALLLSPLLLARPGEIRHMEWSEIDWDREQWEIPAEKMKTRLPHIVPLCPQAIKLLKAQHLVSGRGRYVFPSARGASRPLSDNGVRTALRTLGYDNETMTPHGFRAMGRTLLDEVLGYRVDWIEHQLAHAVRDVNGRAYNRTAHLEARRQMMQGWADYLDTLKASVSA